MQVQSVDIKVGDRIVNPFKYLDPETFTVETIEILTYYRHESMIRITGEGRGLALFQDEFVEVVA